MLIQNNKTKKFYVTGIGFCGNKDQATRLDGAMALVVCLIHADAHTVDV